MTVNQLKLLIVLLFLGSLTIAIMTLSIFSNLMKAIKDKDDAEKERLSKLVKKLFVCELITFMLLLGSVYTVFNID